MLLSTVLRGKAQTVLSALTPDERSDYDTVKQAILKAYELVPEAYRQKFRDLKVNDSQTHVEYVREKERLFDRWCRSRDVTGFDGLRNLVLLEDFKDNVHKGVRVHLDDLDVTDVKEAARRADDYTVTHKLLSCKGKDSFKGKAFDKPNNGGSGDRKGPNHKNYSNNGQKNESGQESRGYRKSRPVFNPNAHCTHCDKKGHDIKECWSVPVTEGAKTQAVALTAQKTEKARTEKQKNQQSEKPKSQSVALISREPVKIGAPEPDIESLSVGLTTGLKSAEHAQAVLNAQTDEHREIDSRFAPFISKGTVTVSPSNAKAKPDPINILRDTGASQSLLLDGVVETSPETYTGSSVIITGIGGNSFTVPLHKIRLESDLVTGQVDVAVAPVLPVAGVQLLLGNDLAGSKVVTDPIVTEKPETPEEEESLDNEFPDLFPACVVTRAMSKKKPADEIELGKTFMVNLDTLLGGAETDVQFTSAGLIEAQASDPEISELIDKALTDEEAAKVPTCFVKRSGVLVRKWRDPTVPACHEWETKYQVVVPQSFRPHVLELAHETPTAGHLGVKKTARRLMEHFWWPGVRKSVVLHCRCCHVCQVVGKPNQNPIKAPLQPIPAFDEPFSQVIIDCVGPLPRTSAGNEYLLTIMCASTRFPEAIPLRNITAQSVVKALLKFFYTIWLTKVCPE